MYSINKLLRYIYIHDYSMLSSHESLMPHRWLALCFKHEHEFFMSFEAELVCLTLTVFVNNEKRLQSQDVREQNAYSLVIGAALHGTRS